jgi:hypothetical protein
MRKKTGNTLDVANINAAWESLFNQNKAHTIDELKKNGWISVIEISSKLNKSRGATKNTMEKAGLEHKKFNVLIDDKVRNIGFFRLKS